MSSTTIIELFLRVHARVVAGLTTIAVGLLVPMMFLVTCDVIGRYVLNRPLPAVFEINSYFLMVAVVFFPLAHVHSRKEHVFVSLFTDRLGVRTRLILETLSLVLGIAVYALIGWYGLQRAISATLVREYISGVVDVPIWISKWFVPIGCFAFCVELAIDGVRHLKVIFSPSSSQG